MRKSKSDRAASNKKESGAFTLSPRVLFDFVCSVGANSYRPSKRINMCLTNDLKSYISLAISRDCME